MKFIGGFMHDCEVPELLRPVEEHQENPVLYRVFNVRNREPQVYARMHLYVRPGRIIQFFGALDPAIPDNVERMLALARTTLC